MHVRKLQLPGDLSQEVRALTARLHEVDGFTGERELDGNTRKAGAAADVQDSSVTAKTRNNGERIDEVTPDDQPGIPDGSEVQATVPEREKVEILAEGADLIESAAESLGAGDEELLVLGVLSHVF